MGLDFVALDFETANSHRGSPCQVGLAVVGNSEVIATRSLLVKPVGPGWDPRAEPLENLFDPFNVMIHGITPEMVADAPAFYEIWPLIRELIGDVPVVAHNAAFDTGVLRGALDVAEMDWPTLDYACTMVLGRRTYDLVSYRLPFVAEAAGVHFDSDAHHDAAYDAEIAARIMLDIAARHDAGTIADLCATTGVRLGRINGDAWEGCTRRGVSRAGWGVSVGDIVINAEADPSGALYGAGVTFTGTLGSMTRAAAWQAVADVGGLPLGSVTKQTTYLVFGYQDARKLAPGAAKSSKFTKAEALRANGQDIEILSEDDWLTMLQQTASEGTRSP
jgi:DNA polymerase III epsilon subunit-like protein